MPNFILNRNSQPNDDHEVHDTSRGCAYLPAAENQIDLGWHANCHGAVAEARRRYASNRINGCYYCAGDCHTT